MLPSAQAAFDQPRRGRRLHDAFLAGAAGIFGTPRHQHAELRRHDVESLGDVFADLVQRALAAWAGFVLDIDDGLDTRQMGRQRTAIASTLTRGFGALSSRTAFFFCRSARFCLLDILQRQQHLVFWQRLGAATEAMTLHLLDDLNEPLVARPFGKKHRLQFVRIVGKRFDRLRHKQSRSYFRARRDDICSADSLCRRSAGQSRRRRLFRAHAFPVQPFEQR